VLFLCIIGVWIRQNRQWNWILLGRPNTLGFAVGLVVAAAYIYLATKQTRAIMKRSDLWPRIRKQMADFEPLAPNRPRERRAWILTAITAGVCEEILFRGFLLAFVAAFIGIIGSVAVNMILFGLFHSYYSWKGTLKTAALGLFLALLAVWSKSIIPGIIIPAIIDLMTGDLAYRILTRPDIGAAPAPELPQ
jgi:membrane protease YdiL (CAAX protease family)